MDTDTHRPTTRTSIRTAIDSSIRTSPGRVLSRTVLACLVAIAATGIPGEPRSASGPDHIADEAGGIAARLHDADGTPIAGDVFLLIGSADAMANARVYDSTPYLHDRAVHPDTVASNLVANRAVRAVTDTHVDVVEMTNAAAGGPSGGLTRAIAYLNVVSNGAFTGGLRVAATGQLRLDGHVGAIDDIDAKTVAADLADADVLFTPTVPSSEARDSHGARLVGELVRGPGTGTSMNDPHRMELFRRWGTGRTTGMDIVDVRHLIDVSSYLCGAGSDFACDITRRLDRQAEERFEQMTREARSEVARFGSKARSASRG